MNTKTIYKYPLAITGNQAVVMPIKAEILSVQFQGEDLCIWAAVDPTERKHVKIFHIFGTGHPIPEPEKMRYLGTAQQFGGRLVWHVFEQTPA